MEKKLRIIGYYNELYYQICSIDNEGQIVKELYNAGNSPFSSEDTVPAEEGVGLENMKTYCEQNSKEIAREEGLEFIGVEYEEIDEVE